MAREPSAAIEQERGHDTNSVPQICGNTSELAGGSHGRTQMPSKDGDNGESPPKHASTISEQDYMHTQAGCVAAKVSQL